MNKKTKILSAFLLAFALSINFILGAASFRVIGFSCSPSEVVINSIFSCTARIENNGDASGSVSTATLYTDSEDWLENSNYPQSSGTSVSPGQTTDIVFTGLRAVKSGNNGFSKIMLDSVTDTYVADNNKKVNVINVVVIVSDTASSAAMGGTWTSMAEVNVGGNADVVLTFASSSGGCSIGSQTNPVSWTGLTDGSKESKSWTITQGTSGSCVYSISASATGASGVASKIDTTSNTITCTDCPVTSTSGSAPGGGGGGGGGVKTYIIGELLADSSVNLSSNDAVSFNISKVEHTLTLKNLTNSYATIIIQSEKQTFIMAVGEEKNIDLNKDNLAEIFVKLKSIDTINKKATFILGKTTGSVAASKSVEETEAAGGGQTEGTGAKEKQKHLYTLIAVFLAIAILSAIAYFYFRRKRTLSGY
jgi:hypothetical protein